MTSTQMVQLVCTTILLITVIVAGIFGTDISARWLRNRREERRNGIREAERVMSERYDRERNSWLAILAEKDRELENLNSMFARLQKNYDIATRVLQIADRKGEEA